MTDKYKRNLPLDTGCENTGFWKIPLNNQDMIFDCIVIERLLNRHHCQILIHQYKVADTAAHDK